MLSRSEARTFRHAGQGRRRWLKVLDLLFALLCGTVGAAEEPPEDSIQVLVTKFRSAEEIEDELTDLLPELREYVKAGEQNVLVVRTLTPELREVVERLILLFDVPEMTYQLRVRLILAHPLGGTAGPRVPRELEDLTALLGSVFTFKRFELLDDAVLMTRTGSPGSIRLAGGEYQLEFLAGYEPSARAQAGEGGYFAFDPFELQRRIVEEEDLDRDETEVNVLTTSFRVRSNSSIVVGASRAEAGTDVALVVVLTVTPANELVQPFLTLDLSTPEATVRSFTKAAASGNVGLAQACFLPGGIDYEDVREVLGADPSQADEHQFSMVMRAIDPDGPITVVSRKWASEQADEVSLTWRVTFKSEVSFTEGGKKVTFKPGDTFNFDASLKKVGDRWLIDGL